MHTRITTQRPRKAEICRHEYGLSLLVLSFVVRHQLQTAEKASQRQQHFLSVTRVAIYSTSLQSGLDELLLFYANKLTLIQATDHGITLNCM